MELLMFGRMTFVPHFVEFQDRRMETAFDGADRDAEHVGGFTGT